MPNLIFQPLSNGGYAIWDKPMTVGYLYEEDAGWTLEVPIKPLVPGGDILVDLRGRVWQDPETAEQDIRQHVGEINT